MNAEYVGEGQDFGQKHSGFRLWSVCWPIIFEQA